MTFHTRCIASAVIFLFVFMPAPPIRYRFVVDSMIISGKEQGAVDANGTDQ